MALAVGLLGFDFARGEERKGAITGTITDSAHAVLPGARIELLPTGQSTASDGKGQFTLSNLTPGNYKLTVSYVGLARFSNDVTVTAGNVTQTDAELKIRQQSEEITVTAERPRGEAAAINVERSADNIVQVLPSEVITSLPNTNVADALGRLPSVSLERDEGEGKYVQIRGTEPRLSNVTVNGVNLPSPESGVRNIKLDVIPADLVDSIQVSKTLSANQDGDAIGSSVNLVTKTAGEAPSFSMSGLGGYTPIIGGRWLDQFGATYARRFGRSKKLGILFGGSYDFNGRGINDVEPSPGTINLGHGLVPNFSTEDIREYRYNRTRYGFAGGADYRLGAGSSAYVKGMYSDFRDYGDTWVYTPNAGNFISPTQADATGNEAYRHYIRRPDQYVSSVTAGADHNLGATLIDYEFSVSRSGQEHGDFPTTNFNGPQNVAFGLDTSDPYRPRFPVLNGVNIYDPTQFTLANTEVTKDHTAQLNLAGSASLTRNYTIGSHFGAFQTGFKIRNAHKTNSVNDLYYDATGSPILLSSLLGGVTDSNYYDGSYQLGPLSDYGKIEAVFKNNPSDFTLNVNRTHQRSDPNNYDTTERVYAEYAMNTLDFGHVRLQTGVRFETTESSFTGYHVTLDTNGDYVSTSPVLGKQTYTNILPSVQFRYALNSNTNIRASYGMGIARPNFGDLPPYIVQDDSRQRVSVGNPALKPTRANNYDLLFERYLQPLGIIQAGIFYKDLSNPIYSTQTTLTSGTYAGYSQTQPINGPHAHIEGFEAAWQQHLSFLPGSLNGIGFTANYGYTASKATVLGRTDRPALVRQAPNNWNVGLTYDKGRISARMGVTHNDAYIYQYNYQDGADLGLKGPNGDIYLYAHTQVDAQGSYRLGRGLDLVVALLNLNNEVFGFYQGSPQYPIQREYYHPTFQVGFRWTPSTE
jgi:TonB-dependent receptor